MFITLEGIDGSGKTTQAEMLATRLRDMEIPVTYLHDPGGTEAGKIIKGIILNGEVPLSSTTELFLYAASRIQLVEEKIKPALISGHIVVCDRFTDSTIAYQHYGRGHDRELVNTICDMAAQGIKPDLTFLIDIDPEVARKRVLKKRQLDAMESMSMPFYHRVRNGYLMIAREEPLRVMVVDGNLSLNSIHESIVESVYKKLKLSTAIAEGR